MSFLFQIINLILRSFFFHDALADTFDNVLLINKLDSLVANGREVSAASSKSKSGVKSLGKMLTKPLDKFKPEAIAQYLITIPLNGQSGRRRISSLPVAFP